MPSYQDTICTMDTKDTCSTVESHAARAERIAPRRPVKIQVCLTPQERAQLCEHARAAGFDSISGYVRARTLGGQRHA